MTAEKIISADMISRGNFIEQQFKFLGCFPDFV